MERMDPGREVTSVSRSRKLIQLLFVTTVCLQRHKWLLKQSPCRRSRSSWRLARTPHLLPLERFLLNDALRVWLLRRVEDIQHTHALTPCYKGHCCRTKSEKLLISQWLSVCVCVCVCVCMHVWFSSRSDYTAISYRRLLSYLTDSIFLSPQ